MDVSKIVSQDPQLLEEKILKAIFKRNNAIIDIMDIVKEEYFTIPDYALIYKAMIELTKTQQQITPETVALWVDDNGYVLSSEVLSRLYNEAYTSQKVGTTAKILKELYLRRHMLLNLRTIIDKQEESPTSSDKILSAINDIAMHSNEIVSTVENDTKCCSDPNAFMAEITKKLTNRVKKEGIKTGLNVIDNELDGFLGGKLWVIVADSQVGKSAFALQLCSQALMINNNLNVFYYSLEMDKSECEERIIANLADIEPRHISDPIRHFNRFDTVTNKIVNDYANNKDCESVKKYKQTLFEASAMLHRFNFHVDDTPDLDITALEARIKRNNLKYGKTDIIIVDHLGILCEGSPNEVVGKMDEAYNKLKQLSKKLNCTIIALHQFSNELKNDPDRFPNIFSLRGSGAPRHYADVICGIWRPEVYPDILKRNPEYKGKCQLVWQKVRYTKKPDVTEMNYNGYKFMEKVLDDTQGNANE